MKISILAILVFISFNTSFSQEKSKKELKKEAKEKVRIANEQNTAKLMESKTFVFIAKTALPSGRRSINLTSLYEVKFKPNLIDGQLPFFGRAYSAPIGVGDGGLTFKSEPEEFNIDKGKKTYLIEAVVKEQNETYNLSLTVGFQGNASLNVTSSNRSPMSFNGNIAELVEKEK